MNVLFVVAKSEIGHDIFLFRVFKATYSISISALALRLPFNHHFTKVWKTYLGSYFQPLNCSPVLTCCLVGLVIELAIFLSVDRNTKFVKLFWSYVLLRKPCLLPRPSVSQTVWKVNDFFFCPITNLSTKSFVCCLLFSQNPFITFCHLLKYKYDQTDE